MGNLVMVSEQPISNNQGVWEGEGEGEGGDTTRGCGWNIYITRVNMGV